MKPSIILESRSVVDAGDIGQVGRAGRFAHARAARVETAFDLPIPTDARRTLALRWLWLGVLALAGSGVFAVMLVLARTPMLHDLFPVGDFFRVALVAHVDLSVLVWFIACAAMLWSVAGPARWPSLGSAALLLGSAGTVLIIVAPFIGSGPAVMANYVPVVDNDWFIYGLVLIASALGVLVMRALAWPGRSAGDRSGSDSTSSRSQVAGGEACLRFGLKAAAITAALALALLVWSLIEVPAGLDAKAYYETVFWGPGHVLQFTWTLLMLVAWLWLASLAGVRVPLSARVASLLIGAGLASALISPLIYLHWPVISVEHHRMFTWLMRFGGGLAIGPIGVAVAIGLVVSARSGASSGGNALAPAACVRAVSTPAERPLRAALLASMMLFALGGVIGFMIKGSDVRIPAHYHGSIVGVTLALMGLAYALAPRLGARSLDSRLALWQIRLYAAGQLLHITGLVWSGGYGVQRKVAGAEQSLRGIEQVAGMGLMGAGGLLAIVGGMLFVVVMLRALTRVRRPDSDSDIAKATGPVEGEGEGEGRRCG